MGASDSASMSDITRPSGPGRATRPGGNGVPVLLLQGWLGSGPGHWQRHWLRLRPHWRLVDFGSWDHPEPQGWRLALARAIGACERPPLLIAHSLGCLAAAGLLAEPGAPEVAAALLVAPPDPGRPDTPEPLRPFHPVPRVRFGVPGQLLLSSDDPYGSEAYALELAAAWGLEPLRLGPLGHINAESGLGPWPEGLALAEALIERVTADG